MSKKTREFRRMESKFLVLENSFEEIRNTLKKHIPQDIFDKTSPYTNIKTIYFDDDKFSIFQEYLSRRKFRFKVRFRNYGHNDVFKKEDFWAELKVKFRGVCFKKRFLFPYELINDFADGKDIFYEISEINSDTRGLKKIYKLMAKLIKINNMKPQLITTYERAAFQNKEKNVRITVDKNITHRSFKNPEEKKSLSPVVFESKIGENCPQWYKELENTLSLLPQKRFSKYATGINTTYFPLRGIYNFYTNFAETRVVSEKIEKSLILIKDKMF